jgi:hypothetical protein
LKPLIKAAVRINFHRRMPYHRQEGVAMARRQGSVALGRKLICLVAGAMGAIAALRMLCGPLPLIRTVSAPLNAEGIFGLAVTILLMTAVRSEPRHAAPGSRPAWMGLALACAVAAVTTWAFGRALGFYFLADDFVLTKRAATYIPQNLRLQFTAGGGDGFYRPIGNVSLALESLWASFSPVLWHASTLALHVANTVLVLFLAWRIGASRWAGVFAAVLFGIHGTSTETAVWIAGRFDLLATFFVLAGLLLFARSCEEPGSSRYAFRAGALACLLLAVLSKESAYIFPFLLLLYVLSKRDAPGYRISAVVPFFVVAALAFAYRWSLFGGVGGYVVAQTRQPQAFSLNAASTLKALAIRLWAALYFPINWSVEPGTLLGLLALAYAAALLWLAFRARPAARPWFPLGFLLLAVLPPLHLLGIGAHLGNSRILYLPSAGFCLMLALAVDGLNRWPRRIIPVVILTFNLAALQHNLNCWAYASAKAESACAAAARYVPPSGKLVVAGIPATIRGVPFSSNGFTECVELNAHGPVQVELIRGSRKPGVDSGTTLLIWDEKAEQLTCAHCPTPPPQQQK